jgi:hypothetical protein
MTAEFLSVSAYHLLKGRHTDFARRNLQLALPCWSWR